MQFRFSVAPHCHHHQGRHEEWCQLRRFGQSLSLRRVPQGGPHHKWSSICSMMANVIGSIHFFQGQVADGAWLPAFL